MKKLSALITLIFTIIIMPMVFADLSEFPDLSIFVDKTKRTSVYSDIDNFYKYKIAVDDITKKGIVKGYSDGSYRPLDKINRAEFTKIIVEAKLGKNPTESAADCFPDVLKSDWFASYVCYAKSQNYIKGYPDGYFKPSVNINLAEAAKILVNVFEIKRTNSDSGIEWYSIYIEALDENKYIPQTFGYIGQFVNRGEMAEMIWRIINKKSDQNSVSASSLETPCQPMGDNLPSGIDISKVRSTWLSWYNGVRQQEGLHAYTHNDQLARTAYVWSEKFKAEKATEMSHKRNPGDAYYDYNKIKAWFKNLGLEFKSGLFTENTGWGVPYYCNESDCTDELISAIKNVFDFYMAEKGQSYDAHYKAVINKNFKEIGLGISIDEEAQRYYVTVHYGTEITSNPLAVCK